MFFNSGAKLKFLQNIRACLPFVFFAFLAYLIEVTKDWDYRQQLYSRFSIGSVQTLNSPSRRVGVTRFMSSKEGLCSGNCYSSCAWWSIWSSLFSERNADSHHLRDYAMCDGEIWDLDPLTCAELNDQRFCGYFALEISWMCDSHSLKKYLVLSRHSFLDNQGIASNRH